MAPSENDVQFFLEIFDEFKVVARAKIGILLGIAQGRVDKTAWGDNWQYAYCLLTAHMIASSGGSGGAAGAGGALTAEAVGDLSRSFAKMGVAGSGDEELQSTQYGAQFVALRRETLTTAMVTGPQTALPPQRGGTIC